MQRVRVHKSSLDGSTEKRYFHIVVYFKIVSKIYKSFITASANTARMHDSSLYIDQARTQGGGGG